MIGIFYLGRSDIWPETDTGIRNACTIVFRTTDFGKIKKYVKDCETVAALYLWELINRKLLKQIKQNG
jgi:3-methyladenine DNA glycosylase/8-oxoguanine DNA glycosylase